MEPCPFVRLIVESLALKLPAMSKPAGHGVHPSTTPCFCVLQLQDYSSSSPQTSPLPLANSSSNSASSTPSSEKGLTGTSPAPVVFSIDPSMLQRLAGNAAKLTAAVYVGRTGSTCGLSAGRLLGRVRVAVHLGGAAAQERPVVAHSGWVAIGSGACLHIVVRAEPDPRFVFQFGGEPECSPVVYQIPGGVACGGKLNGGCVRQPVFSCRFSAERRRTTRSRSLPTDLSSTSSSSSIKSWLLSTFSSDRSHSNSEQRKGWMVTIHDLSGSPVAAASMVTPFVPSPSSDRVSRSNPGAWLILRPAGPSPGSWKPWGRLEAWRERSPIDALGYRFQLVADDGSASSGPIAESSINVRKGGQFLIDPSAAGENVSKSWPLVGGFVMASTVEGEGKVSKPTVKVGVQHVTCMADVALFVALAAAVDLSVDACQLFSHKLRKELCHDTQDYIS